MKNKIQILETFKTIHEINRIIPSEFKLDNMDNYYQIKGRKNEFVNCVKVVPGDKFVNDFSYDDKIWYEKIREDAEEYAKEDKSEEIDYVFRQDVIRLSGGNKKMYKYIGAYKLNSTNMNNGTLERKWIRLDGHDTLEYTE